MTYFTLEVARFGPGVTKSMSYLALLTSRAACDILKTVMNDNGFPRFRPGGRIAMKRFSFNLTVLAVLMVLFSLVFAVNIVAAQGLPGPVDDPVAEVPPLEEVIVRLTTVGGVGVVVSLLIENMGWFQRLTIKGKSTAVFILSIGLPTLAHLALATIPPEVWAGIEPYWQTIALGFQVWAATQITHKLAHGGSLAAV